MQTKVFKGTVVNRKLSTLHGGSLEITLTVPLNYKLYTMDPANRKCNLEELVDYCNCSPWTLKLKNVKISIIKLFIKYIEKKV